MMARKRRQWESRPPDGVNIESKVRKAGSAQLIGGVTYRFAAVRHRRAGKGRHCKGNGSELGGAQDRHQHQYQHGAGPENNNNGSFDLEKGRPSPKNQIRWSEGNSVKPRFRQELVDSAKDAEGRLPPTKGRNSHGLSGATRRTGLTRVLGRIWTEWARISNPATTMNGQAFRLHSLPQPSSLFMFDRQAKPMTQKWPKKTGQVRAQSTQGKKEPKHHCDTATANYRAQARIESLLGPAMRAMTVTGPAPGQAKLRQAWDPAKEMTKQP
ncbi:hypothetical protein CNYM01_03752 [Colletotrichum nymphaeae SA-01]|uniref:Uncharacterized protein n=1 Tax=Colletotrichum nymphaeae SA-01 TaxID=1460502 RepID=A0A135ULR6_9PEZI|nr:hypothetical protein CNYM01_03752 [Colletotrichum nymphaeae SA-01]